MPLQHMPPVTKKENPPKEGSFIRLRDTRRDAEKAGDHTSFVACLRWALPILVLGLVTALIIWPMVGAKKIKMIADEAVPNLVVEELKMSGMNAKNEPYALTAHRALEVAGEKNIMDLEQPTGELTTLSGSFIKSRADHGRFDQENKKLWLGGDVALFHDNGTEFYTSEAQVDLKTNKAWGDQPVVIQGTFGEITGQGFRLYDGGKIMIVKGKSRALLSLRSGSPSGSKE